MTSSPNPTAVPRDVEDVASFTANFMAHYGFPPIAGGEGTPGEPPAGAAPPPAPDPAPAPPEPAAPDVPMTEATAQQLLSRFDEITPPAPVDPLAVELGLQPEPPAMPGQPQAQPGLTPPGQPAAPSALPGQPQQPGATLPGVNPDEAAVISSYIQAEARKVAQEMLDREVRPQFERYDVDRRRAEMEGFVAEHPELENPAVAQELLSRARNWATQLGMPDRAREPGFLELTFRANRDILAEQAQKAGQPVVPAQPGANGEVPIEQPGPAAPAGAAGNQDPAQRIVESGKGHGLSPVFL